MGQEKRHAKGAVSIVNAEGRIRLRWRFQGKRYSINHSHYTKANLSKAKSVALTIENDLLAGTFDFTLIKYRNPSSIISKTSLVESYEAWTKTFKNKDCNVDKHYHTLRNMLKRWGDIQPVQIIEKLNQESLCASTYNKRLRMLSEFVDFLVLKGLVQTNLLKAVQPRKTSKTPKNNRRPFTEDEIKKILEAFMNDSFSSHIPMYKHSHYYPFIYFIFKTGVRNAEAIGLRVGSIDFNSNLIHIKEVLARTVKGTNAGQRVRKETKNGKHRMIPLTFDLKEVLLPLLASKKSDDLVFLSPKGNAIDDRMFQRRVFGKVLNELDIEHRVLYACRHTFNSRCIQAGINPVITAFLMGNNPETALRNYTHLVDLPSELPKL